MQRTPAKADFSFLELISWIAEGAEVLFHWRYVVCIASGVGAWFLLAKLFPEYTWAHIVGLMFCAQGVLVAFVWERISGTAH